MNRRLARLNTRPLAALTLALALAALGSTPARADDGIVAYGAAITQEQRTAKAQLDRQMNGAADQANAALTADLRLALDGRVRSKLRLAGTRVASRG